ncbi:cell cycle checkpoint control protein RAD9A-like isoform X2 [Limulus polyphemus]|uniref:Cell cycle checkpoint control protein RAD9A-like isoform X2 n=1 Tax=Limulus polyphemus TaxID=6850 RepID=A0ABM1SKT8_LIMPO|nr:cell cycle checkpoint control protein RAD9A-like isoform X2 [Limulus polyphemus]
MKGIIPGNNVKVFGRAIHALAKIGEDIYIESEEAGLFLQTVNSARSAYACLCLSPHFFAIYEEGSGIKWKVAMKSCMMAFKSLTSLEKNVDKCCLELGTNEDKLIVQLHQKHVIESETLQAVFQKNGSASTLTAQSRLMSDGIQNFQASVEEVTLSVSPDKVTLCNFVDDEPDPTKVVHTALSLEPEEFENYQLNHCAEITFCLKEFRAVLTLSEGSNVPVSISFEDPGRPIIFSVKIEPDLEADFVLATLADHNKGQLSSSGSSSPQRNINKPTSVVVSRPRKSLNNKHAQEVVSKQALHLPLTSTSPSMEHKEMEEYVVPGTPPSKRFCSMFLGLSQPSQFTSMAPDPDEVLAEATDEEES